MSEKSGKTDKFELIPEGEGKFLKLCFDGEETPTIIFIADQDLENLQNLAEKEEKSWRDFRNEFFTLVEHTGHNQEHELGEESTKELRQFISDFKE